MRARQRTVLWPAAFFGLVWLVFGLVWLAIPGSAAAERIRLCHVPPDDPQNVQIMELPPVAAQKHVERHGDSILDGAGEVCDGRDNDCDREVDEDFPDLGLACSDGVGACRRSGQKVCSPDGTGTLCSAVAGEPGVEVCAGGGDEDCDGLTDCGDAADCAFDPACKVPVCGDGFIDVGEDCDDPQNACCVGCRFDVGAECDADGNACTRSACDATGTCTPETTDGESCSGNGEDACSGPDTCLAGVCQDNGPNAAPDVPCNGLDEDCVGGDAEPTGSCTTGLPGVCSAGTLACGEDAGGQPAVVCSQTTSAGAESCADGLDNDCDGLADCDDGDCSSDPACGPAFGSRIVCTCICGNFFVQRTTCTPCEQSNAVAVCTSFCASQGCGVNTPNSTCFQADPQCPL